MLIGKAIDWAKSPRQSSAVFLACLTFLVILQRCFHQLGLESIQRYRGWVSIALILSSAITAVEIGFGAWQKVRTHIDVSKKIKERENYMLTLSGGEQFILAKYLAQNSETQYLPAEDGTVGSLLTKGMIYRASDVGRFTTFAYNIQPWARDYIQKHPEVIANPSPPPRTPFQRMRS